MPSTDQMARVIALAQALAASKRGVILRRFAEERGWSLRYVYRDLHTLERAGFPIASDAGRYWLPQGWNAVAASGVAADELLALFVARQLATGLRGTAAGRALDRLWSKLSSVGRQGQLLPAGTTTVSVRSESGIDYTQHRRAIVALEEAIAARRAVNARYRRSRTGEITERTIEPGQLYFDQGLETLYLVGWCRLREAVRVFAVHRFLAVEPSEDPTPMRPQTRSAEALRTAFRIWRSDGVETVRLRFSPAVAAEIAERRWHASQQLDPLVGGGLVMTLEIAEPEEIVRWLLGFGPDVQVLAPASLADAVRARHAAAIAPTGARHRAARGPEDGLTRSDNGTPHPVRMGTKRPSAR